MTVMEPARHARRDTSIWPTVLGVLVGSVIAITGFGIVMEVIR